MISGIQWILGFIMFMFTFQFKVDFVKQSSTMNPIPPNENVRDCY